MADPLSVASGIVGLLAAAGKVVEILGLYISAARDTPKIARSVNSEVISSRIILTALRDLLDNLSVVSRNRRLLIPIDHLVVMVTDGTDIFSELESLVSRINVLGSERLLARMQWVRKEDDFTAILVRLQSFKSSMMCLLNILQCDSDQRAAQTQDEFSANLLKIILENTSLSRRLESLEDSFDARSYIEPQMTTPSQKSLTSPSENQTDMDDQSFYSVETTKPISEYQNPEPTPGQSDSSSSVPTFEFQAALDESVPYRRARADSIDFSTRSSVAASNAWSVFSRVSLSDISILSRVAIPVFPKDISNSYHYEFMKPTTKRFYPSPQRLRKTPDAYMHVDERAIGLWSQWRKRVLKPYELRVEVQFEVPVIYVSSPNTVKGPVQDAEVLSINGTPESLSKTLTELPGTTARHMPHNALASWVVLLSALQHMEHDSRAWQRTMWLQAPKSSWEFGIDELQLDVSQKYSVNALVQRKRMSWDYLPPNFQKPYAITIWSHIIELAAMLGIYWTEFNQSHKVYRAQGNGYMVTSETVPNFGTVFTFSIYGRNRFQQNRVIPNAAIQCLCFGIVRTIFATESTRSWRVANIDGLRPSYQLMRVASSTEIAESLRAIGCNTSTTKSFLQDKIVVHIFPVVFEIIGMIADSIHIKDSMFRMIPNPTQYRWVAASHPPKQLLRAFLHQLASSTSNGTSRSIVQSALLSTGRHIVRQLQGVQDDYTKDFILLNRIHEGVDNVTAFLTAPRDSQRRSNGNQPEMPLATVQSRRPSSSGLEADKVDHDPERRKLVLLTLRYHIQVTLSGLNGDGDSKFRPEADTEANAAQNTAESLPWQEFSRSPVEFREAKLMEVYFHVVRPKVVSEVENLANQWGFPLSAHGSCLDTRTEVGSRSTEDDLPGLDLWETDEFSFEDIWCALVFRSICWLMLHDFHPDDVQITKSGLFGSREAVYIQ